MGFPLGPLQGMGFPLGWLQVRGPIVVPRVGVPIGELLGQGFPLGWLQVRASGALGPWDPLGLRAALEDPPRPPP